VPHARAYVFLSRSSPRACVRLCELPPVRARRVATHANAGIRAKKRVYERAYDGEKGNNTHGVRELHQVFRNGCRAEVQLRISLLNLEIFPKREIRSLIMELIN